MKKTKQGFVYQHPAVPSRNLPNRKGWSATAGYADIATGDPMSSKNVAHHSPGSESYPGNAMRRLRIPQTQARTNRKRRS